MDGESVGARVESERGKLEGNEMEIRVGKEEGERVGALEGKIVST